MFSESAAEISKPKSPMNNLVHSLMVLFSSSTMQVRLPEMQRKETLVVVVVIEYFKRDLLRQVA